MPKKKTKGKSAKPRKPKPKKKAERRPVDPKDVKKWGQLFLKGWTLAELAEEYDRRPQLILKHLHANGITAASRKKKATKKKVASKKKTRKR